jgi:Cu/Ag efflux pump CusA
LGIRHLLPITDAESLAKVPIDGNKTKRLGDVATVVEDHQPLIGDAIVNDAPALMLVVEKFPWANTTEVTEGVEAALAAMRPGLTGLNMDPSLFRPATYMEEGLNNFTTVLMIGGILMIVALFALLFSWRATLISTVAVILSLFVTATIFYIRGTEINYMIMAGVMLAVLAIIDDAIIDVGNFMRRLRESREAHEERLTSSIVMEAALQMRKPVLYATVIMVLTVVPLLFLEGVSGAFFGPIATSYILAVVVSMAVALIVTPVLSLLLFRKVTLKEGDSPVAGMLRGIYSGLFGWAARSAKPMGAFVAVCVLVIFALASFAFLRQETLLPDLKETDLVVRWEGNTGASHPAMTRITTLASRELRSIPGVRNVSAHMGRAIMGDKQTNINSGELWINIDPSADYEATVAAAKKVVSGYPGLSPVVLTYRQAQVRQELSGTGESLVVRVYGDDFDIITQKAEEVQRAIAGIDGIADAKVQYPNIMPTLEIEVDLDRAKLYGLKPGDIRRTATTLASGLLVGNLFEEQKVFEVVVYSTPETRHSISSIENLLIDTPSGGHVMLKDVAHVRIAPSPTVINRDAVARRIDVTARVQGRDLGSVAADVESGIQKVSFPLEYRAELLGEYADRLAAQNRLTSFAIAAVIVIFLLMQAFFRSWRLATAVFFTLPMALLGGMIAVFISTGGVLTLGSSIGFIAVYGLAVRQSLTLVNHYRDLEHANGDNFDAGLIAQGTLDQAAPILTTTITAILAILPLLFFGGIAGLEILHPMGIVMLGGTITTAIYTLIGIPAMYTLFGQVHEAEKVEAEVFA